VIDKKTDFSIEVGFCVVQVKLVIAQKTCTIFRHTLSANVFSKGTMKSIHCLRLKFISKVYRGLPNVCLILGNFRNSLSIIYVISIICHSSSFRGF
jgi:hypothetical protein